MTVNSLCISDIRRGIEVSILSTIKQSIKTFKFLIEAFQCSAIFVFLFRRYNYTIYAFVNKKSFFALLT